MSQHDYNIANQGFPGARTDLNNALSAIATNNSGATAPASTFAHQWWYDSTANILKMRNAANNAWINIGTFDQGANSWRLVGSALSGIDANPAPDTTLTRTLGTSSLVWDNVFTRQINTGPLAGFRNAIINGNFDVWQRGTSFTTNDYGADRWVNGIVGSSATQSRQAFTLGQTDVPGEPQYYMRTVVTSVAGAANLANTQQRIEDVRSFAGQTVTVSFYAKADASKSIAINFVQNFGTGGSPSSQVVVTGQKKALTTSWQLVTATFSIPSISGKTIGTNGDSSLRFFIWYDAGSDWNSFTDSLGQQSGTFEISRVQIELGPVATPFERRPIGTELALCQRYLPAFRATATNTVVGNGYSYTTTGSFIYVALPVTPRVRPTGITVDTVGNFELRNGSNVGGTPTAITFTFGGTLSTQLINVTTTAGSPTIAAGNGAFLFATGAASILFTGCEL